MKDLGANLPRTTTASRCVRGVLGFLAGLGLAPWLAAAPVEFARDIQPLLAEHCVRCHGEEQQKGGLRLDAPGPARQGGDSGPAFVPGRSADSRLLQLVAGTDPKKVMPPKGARLSAAQVDLVRRWIDAGAVWPDDGGAAPVRSRHWSFQPLRPSAELVAAQPGLPRAGSTVDAFILARLATNGLALSPPADRRTLIRRLSFDLTGLPPAPAEVDAFVADRSPRAYEALVERLLASPRHGERWGRHWLDVVRYTESHGFEYDKLRDHAWHYRDYVIRSFNEDKPYDRFMREQIAGDVLEPVTSEGIVATSLLVCGPWDEAGSSQANITQRMLTREEEMEDLVGTVGQTFLGVTLNCARCHSHKFDPIPLEEYYRVRSVFDGVRHGERSILSASEARAREERKAALERELAAAQAVAARLEAEGGRRAAAARAPGAPPPGPAPALLWSFAEGASPRPAGELLGGAVVSGGRLRLPKAGAHFRSAPLERAVREKTLEAWVALDTLDQGGGAAIAIEDESGTTFDAVVYAERQPRKWMAGSSSYQRTRDLQAPVETEPAGTLLHVAVVYRADNRIAVYRNGQPYGEPYTPGGSLRTYAAGRSRVLLGMRHTGGGRPFLTGEIQQAALYDRALEPAEVAASFRAAGLHVSRGEALVALSAAEKAERAGALARVEALRADLKAIPGGAQSYVGKRQQPEPARVLRRGDLRSPAGVVTPAGLSVLRDTRPDFGLAADAPEAERRRKFAAWLSDPQNPLPARVMANRVWQFHFGQGLVATPNDLGHAGARPTHPELLDWLAARFIESGWSVKALHRLIVNSDTYRQAGTVPPGPASALDADNALLWRFPARRLEAEAVRDAILAVSGELNLAMGGPSFRPFDVLKFPANVYQPVDKLGPEYNRRTVYRMNVNSGKEPLLDAFDCPDPAVKTPRRGVTITPLQALALMNNAFVQRQAGHLADRVLREAGGDLAGAVREAHRLTLGRDPTREEARRALAAARDRGLAGVCWVLLNSTEFLYVR